MTCTEVCMSITQSYGCSTHTQRCRTRGVEHCCSIAQLNVRLSACQGGAHTDVHKLCTARQLATCITCRQRLAYAEATATILIFTNEVATKKHRLRIRSQHTPLQVVVKFVQRVAGSLLQSVQSILVLVVRLSPLDLQLNGLPGACWGHLETWRKQST